MKQSCSHPALDQGIEEQENIETIETRKNDQRNLDFYFLLRGASWRLHDRVVDPL